MVLLDVTVLRASTDGCLRVRCVSLSTNRFQLLLGRTELRKIMHTVFDLARTWPKRLKLA